MSERSELQQHGAFFDGAPVSDEQPEPHFAVRPAAPRWTHIALRVDDVEASIAWYEQFTPFDVLARNQDEFGFGAWLGQPDTPEHPFILVLAQFLPGLSDFADAEKEVLRSFAHLGIELPSPADVDAIAERGDAAGCLAMPPRQLPPPVGYICMLRDPDGNLVEYSFDQGVYATARERWGEG
jgi:lactoylglutathione lyase